MNENTYPAICAQVNAAFEIRQLITWLGYLPDKLKRDGEVYLAFCPIHRDTVFRTLVLNPRNNTYHCTHGACSAHQPADYLDLIVRVKSLTIPEAIDEAIRNFGPEYFRITPKQQAVIDDLVKQVRASRKNAP